MSVNDESRPDPGTQSYSSNICFLQKCEHHSLLYSGHGGQRLARSRCSNKINWMDNHDVHLNLLIFLLDHLFFMTGAFTEPKRCLIIILEVIT